MNLQLHETAVFIIQQKCSLLFAWSYYLLNLLHGDSIKNIWGEMVEKQKVNSILFYLFYSILSFCVRTAGGHERLSLDWRQPSPSNSRACAHLGARRRQVACKDSDHSRKPIGSCIQNKSILFYGGRVTWTRFNFEWKFKEKICFIS